VFCPKYRKKILQDDIAEYIKQQIYILCRQKDLVEVLELNVQVDHVHLIVSIPPKYSVSAFMGFLKGKIALRLFQKYDRVGKKFWGRYFWSRGYCVSTVGLDEERIRKYVKWQQKKDKEIEDKQRELFE
jgi:putative transposase